MKKPLGMSQGAENSDRRFYRSFEQQEGNGEAVAPSASHFAAQDFFLLHHHRFLPPHFDLQHPDSEHFDLEHSD